MGLVCPNYTPDRWWECDMFAVSKAGYASEFEIKLSLADFRADAKKSRETSEDYRAYIDACRAARDEGRHVATVERVKTLKHSLLAQGSDYGPKFFWFVVSDEIREAVEAELPEWAGLKVARACTTKYASVRTVKRAPQLHKTKVDDKVLEHCRGVFYWRYWNTRT